MQNTMTPEEFIDKYHDDPHERESCRDDLEQVIKQAIAEHEAKQWNKYPENKPEKSGIYYCLIQHSEDKKDDNDEGYELNWQTYEMARYYAEYGEFYSCVIAFRELPSPYQPEEEICPECRKPVSEHKHNCSERIK